MISMKQIEAFLQEAFPDYGWKIASPYYWDCLMVFCTSPNGSGFSVSFPISGVTQVSWDTLEKAEAALKAIGDGLINQRHMHLEGVL